MIDEMVVTYNTASKVFFLTHSSNTSRILEHSLIVG